MAKTINTFEPAEITAGDTIVWHKDLPDYPAGEYILHYKLVNAAGNIAIAAAQLGTTQVHAVTISAATSAAYAAGQYQYQAYVTKGAERYTVGSGVMTVKPNIAAAIAGLDTRSSAQKCLDQLDLALETYGNKAYTQSYSIAGRNMSFTSPADFLTFRNKVQQEVNREKAAERAKNGLSTNRKSMFGFR
jgi:hypothetical protein